MSLATVAVVPRERFRLLVDSLNSLFSTIADDVPVIVVDGNPPDEIRESLSALQRQRPFDWIQNDAFVLPNKARNLALDRVQTKYVAFCDNDLQYEPRWLNALVENAETNSSVAVSPVTLIGPNDPPVIHHAGGSFWVSTDRQGRTVLHDRHRLDRKLLRDAEAGGFEEAPVENRNFEYHCVLVNSRAMREVGGHDERLINHEHLDSSLRLMMAGGRLTFESGSRVTYRAVVPFIDEDWPYFLYRWAWHRQAASDQIFSDTWGVFKNPELGKRWIKFHRERAMSTTLPKLPKAINRGIVRRSLISLRRAQVERLDPGLADDPSPRALPKAPANGLELAGLGVS